MRHSSRLFIIVLSLHLVIRSHLFQPLRVGRPDEVSLHVVNAALRVHQVLILLPLDLDHAHDYAVNHVH